MAGNEKDAKVVVDSRIKRIIKDTEQFNVASDFLPALDEFVKDKVTKAMFRAKANNRKTVKASDL